MVNNKTQKFRSLLPFGTKQRSKIRGFLLFTSRNLDKDRVFSQILCFLHCTFFPIIFSAIYRKLIRCNEFPSTFLQLSCLLGSFHYLKYLYRTPFVAERNAEKKKQKA